MPIKQQPQPAANLDAHTRFLVCDAYLTAIDYAESCPRAQMGVIVGWRTGAHSDAKKQAACEYLARHALADLRAIRRADEAPGTIEEIAAVIWPESEAQS